MKWVLGIDIGGTNLVLGAVSEDGASVVGIRTRATNSERGPTAVLDDLSEMAQETLQAVHEHDANAEFLGIGAGAPGPLDTHRGIVLLTPNLGWVNMPLRDELQERLKLPTYIDNDANCAVLGECWLGAARGAKFVVGVTIGTGIGGGIVINGLLHHGASDCAGEIGHMTVDLDGRRCGCGNYGCLEAYASGPAIAQRAVEQIKSGVPTMLTEMVNGDLPQVTAQTVYQAASLGDALAHDVVRKTAGYLGAGLASLINILNPDVVVVVGGVTQAGDRLFEPLRFEVARRAFRPAVDACQILPGTLPGTAGVVGAARMYLNRAGRAQL